MRGHPVANAVAVDTRFTKVMAGNHRRQLTQDRVKVVRLLRVPEEIVSTFPPFTGGDGINPRATIPPEFLLCVDRVDQINTGRFRKRGFQRGSGRIRDRSDLLPVGGPRGVKPLPQ